jgi:hypothetical protein
MTGAPNRFGFQSRPVSWRGRSGRSYDLFPEPVETFSLHSSFIYLVARGSHVLWVGSAEDVIADQQSRARFRLALAAADRAFGIAGATPDPTARMTTIWDLEGAEPEAGAVAA